MKYNPQNMGGGKPLPNRRSIRLKGYDYSQAGLYFITICVQDRKCLFGKIGNGEMILNEYGIVAHQQWQQLPERFTNMELDVFQIMPNHMHGIIMLTDTNTKTVGDIVGAYKSLVANDCLKILKQKWAGVNPAPTMGKLWQRNYWEHIIRDEQSYQRISDYIINNPKNWTGDKFYDR